MEMILKLDPTNPDEVKSAHALMAKFAVATVDDGETTFMPLMNRIGENAAEFLRKAKNNTKAGESFTCASLATASGVPERKLKAWHRNLSRTVNNLGDKAPVLFTEKWDGARQHYTLTNEARAAI